MLSEFDLEMIENDLTNYVAKAAASNKLCDVW